MDKNNLQDVILSYMGTFKIKYDILKKLFEDIPKVNQFHIDVTSLLHKLTSDLSDKDIVEYKYTLISSILNLCGHYRRFFVTKMRYKNEIPIYVYINGNDNYQFINIEEILKIICYYIPKIYLIQYNSLHPTPEMEYLLKKNDLILSKNKIEFQLISDKVNFLYPNRDNSYIVDKPNNLYSIALAISGYKRCGFDLPACKKYSSIDKVSDKLNDALSNGYIDNKHVSDVDYFMQDLGIDELIPYTEQIRNNYDIIDKEKNKIRKSDKIKINDSIIDKISISDLSNLNSLYFKGVDVIQLDDLLM